MARYSILAWENTKEIEVCQVDSNPEAVAKAIASKTKMIHQDQFSSRKTCVPKYAQVRIIDNHAS